MVGLNLFSAPTLFATTCRGPQVVPGGNAASQYNSFQKSIADLKSMQSELRLNFEAGKDPVALLQRAQAALPHLELIAQQEGLSHLSGEVDQLAKQLDRVLTEPSDCRQAALSDILGTWDTLIARAVKTVDQSARDIPHASRKFRQLTSVNNQAGLSFWRLMAMKKEDPETEPPSHSLGQEICRLRELRGVTLRELAKQVGVSRAAISGWEQDVYCPKANSRDKLEEALGVEAGHLAQFIEIKQPAGSLGAEIAKLRISFGMTQAELAEKTGVAISMINKCEWNKRHPHPNLKRKLEKVLCLEKGYLDTFFMRREPVVRKEEFGGSLWESLFDEPMEHLKVLPDNKALVVTQSGKVYEMSISLQMVFNPDIDE